MESAKHPGASLSASPNDIQCNLEEISDLIARWQIALLERRLPELESCTARQRHLCQALQNLLRSPGAKAAAQHPGVAAAARYAHELVRLFAAVLRRVRRNQETLHQAFVGSCQLYKQSSPIHPELKI